MAEGREIARRASSNDLGLWTPAAQAVIRTVNIEENVAPTQGVDVEDIKSPIPKVVNLRMDNSTSMRHGDKPQSIIKVHNLLVRAIRKGYNPEGVLFGSSFMNGPEPTQERAFFMHGRDVVRLGDSSPAIRRGDHNVRETYRYSQIINPFAPITPNALEEDAQVQIAVELEESELYLQGFSPFYGSGVDALTATGAKLDEFKSDYRTGIGITILTSDGMPEKDTRSREDLRTMVTSLMPTSGADERAARNLVVGFGIGDEVEMFTELFLGVGIPKQLILTSRAREADILEKFDMIATMTTQANEGNIAGLVRRGFN